MFDNSPCTTQSVSCYSLCPSRLRSGSNDGIDEWYSPTWSSVPVVGTVDVNTLPGASAACILGAGHGSGAGPLLSVVAGGWTHSGRTGAAVYSSQRHTPFWTGTHTLTLTLCAAAPWLCCSVHSHHLHHHDTPARHSHGAGVCRPRRAVIHRVVCCVCCVCVLCVRLLPLFSFSPLFLVLVLVLFSHFSSGQV